MIDFISLSQLYINHFERRLKGRYICLKHIDPILFDYEKIDWVEVSGSSEKGKKIPLIKIGNGPKKVLAWSQMHGNESTTTKALFDLFAFLAQKEVFQDEIATFFSTFTIFAIPILNPDGAALYTRENANSIDLNRDAKDQSQKESRVLRELFKNFKPDLCLNLHDQRTMYSLPEQKPATISFLAPAADEERLLTESRKIAMQHIAKINSFLQTIIPGQVGRYDDSFNENCVGDQFQMAGVPTILFEAGHFKGDYEREKTREMVFYAFLALFEFLDIESGPEIVGDYFAIPENRKDFRDVILRNVMVKEDLFDIVIQFEEHLEGGKVGFVPVVEIIEKKSAKYGHREIDCKGEGVLINSHENVFVNEKISTIYLKSSKKRIIL